MYSSSPLVTVLMSVYNGEKYLPETIESILNQTFTNFEFLIIDDGSSDNSIKIIESYDDPKIRLICNDENIGQTKTLNKGIKLAKGNFIARSDQDDISSSNRLSIQYNYLNNNPNVALLGSSVYFINNNGSLLYKKQVPTGHNHIMESFCAGNPFMHSSVMFNRDVVMKLDGYSPRYIYSQDADLWLRIARIREIENLKSFLVSIRVHRDQVINNFTFNKLRYKEASKIYYRISKLKYLSKESGIISNFATLYYQFRLNKTIKLFFVLILFLINNVHVIFRNKYILKIFKEKIIRNQSLKNRE